MTSLYTKAFFTLLICTLLVHTLFAQGYKKDRIVYKLKTLSNVRTFNKDYTVLGNSAKRFPSIKAPSEVARRNNNQLVDLSDIYTMVLAPNVSVQEAINTLQKDKNVLYAEPIYIYKHLSHVPNDPGANPANFPTDDDAKKNNYQYYLEKIKAYEAWDIEKGSPSTIIGIIDYGFLIDHEDLIDNLHPDYYDVANNDTDIKLPNSQGYHGVAVAGIAAATPNNGKGIAGVGYNCKYLPVKVISDDFQIFNLEKALEYLADKGAKVINMSFGNPSNYSHYLEDLMDYYVINKNIVLVAAAGNDGLTHKYFPASCKNVISVGGTNQSDIRWNSSTHNYEVDIMAPSHHIRTTYYNCCAYGGVFDNTNSYIPAKNFDFNGTSFAAPQVSAAAALVATHFPTLNARQIRARLEAAADNIDDKNPSIKDLIGQGRLNIYKALNLDKVQYLSSAMHTYDALPTPSIGKEVMLSCMITNLLDPTTNLVVSLSTDDARVSIQKNTTTLGAIGTLEVKPINDPFIVTFDPSIPDDTKIHFKLTYSEKGNKLHHEFFEVTVKSRYYTLDKNELKLTIDNVGGIAHFEQCHFCAGISWDKKVMAQKGGLMIGYKEGSTTKVSNNVITYSATNQFETSNSFESLSLFVTQDSPSIKSISNIFSDINDANKIGLEVTQKTYAYTEPSLKKIIFLEYQIKNKSGKDLNDVFLGIFTDWDLAPYNQNKTIFNMDEKLAYVTNDHIYMGIRLISEEKVNNYSIENQNDTGDGITLQDGFSIEEKYTVLSTPHNTSKSTDIAQTLSAKIDLLPKEGKHTITFALVPSDNLQDLIKTSQKAKEKHIDNNRASEPAFEESLEVCQGASLTLTAQNDALYRFYKDAEASTLIHQGKTYTFDAVNEDQKIFVVNTVGKYPSKPKAFDIKVKPVHDLLLAFPDTLIVRNNELSLSTKAVLDNVTWTIDGQKQSGKQVVFKNIRAGSYILSIDATLEGCHYQVSKTILVKKIRENTLLFPNPITNNILSVQSRFLNCQWQILDYTGKIVSKGKALVPDFKINTKGLPKGTYILQLNGEDQKETKYFVIND